MWFTTVFGDKKLDFLSEDIISSKYSPLFKTETSIDSAYFEYKTSFPNKSIILKNS